MPAIKTNMKVGAWAKACKMGQNSFLSHIRTVAIIVEVFSECHKIWKNHSVRFDVY